MRNKSIFILLFVMMFCFSFAVADDFVLDGLSFDELVALKDRINLAIWNSQEWQEVVVPQGDWIVGEDIPVGKWTIKCADVNRTSWIMRECDVEWGYLREDGFIDHYSYVGGGDVDLFNKNSEHYDTGYLTEIVADLKEGMIVRVKDAYAPALFSPYSGKPSLGFTFSIDVGE